MKRRRHDGGAVGARLDPATSIGITPQALDRLVRQARLQVEARDRPRIATNCWRPSRSAGWACCRRRRRATCSSTSRATPSSRRPAGSSISGASTHRRRRRLALPLVRVRGPRRREARVRGVHRLRLRRGSTTDPDLHVYHYAAYETSAITRLMGEHATREAEVDDLLRRGVFVDLYQVVRQALQISYDSYSLKKVRQFFMTGAGAGRGDRRRRLDPRVPALSRNWGRGDSRRRSVTTTKRTANPRGSCATGCWRARPKRSASSASRFRGGPSRRVPRRRPRTTTRIARCATRLERGRAGRRLGDGSAGGRGSCITWWTITGAKPSPAGGRSSTG